MPKINFHYFPIQMWSHPRSRAQQEWHAVRICDRITLKSHGVSQNTLTIQLVWTQMLKWLSPATSSLPKCSRLAKRLCSTPLKMVPVFLFSAPLTSLLKVSAVRSVICSGKGLTLDTSVIVPSYNTPLPWSTFGWQPRFSFTLELVTLYSWNYWMQRVVILAPMKPTLRTQLHLHVITTASYRRGSK